MLNTFTLAATAVGATVRPLAGCAAVAAAIRELAAAEPLLVTPLPAPLAAELADLPRAPLTAAADTRLCLSHAAAAIAATGTLLIDLNDPAERAATALAPLHCVVLAASTIVATLGDLEAQLSARLAAPGNCYFSLTTGPSRTADIERVLTIGVHGAKELHILIDTEA